MLNLWLFINFVGILFSLSNGYRVFQVKPVRGRDGNTYLPFYAKEYPYSNHFVTDITMDGKVFMSTEQYYFYRKAQIFGDKWAEKQLLTETDPMKAKDIGRGVKNFDQHKWDEVSYTIMKRVIFEKFKQHRQLKEKLMETGHGILVEAAPKDYRWGVGLAQSDPRITDMNKWRGTNFLGKALMEVRTGFRHKADEKSPDIGNRKQDSNGKFHTIFYSRRNMLHNFYPTEVLYIDGLGFRSVQHYFAYTKAIKFGEDQLAEKIREEPSPKKAKEMSFNLKNFDQQKWDAISYKVMLKGLKAKFEQNDYMKRVLKATGSDGIIFSDYNNLRWSAGLDAFSSDVVDPQKWKGKNLLGKALEEVRSSL